MGEQEWLTCADPLVLVRQAFTRDDGDFRKSRRCALEACHRVAVWLRQTNNPALEFVDHRIDERLPVALPHPHPFWFGSNPNGCTHLFHTALFLSSGLPDGLNDDRHRAFSALVLSIKAITSKLDAAGSRLIPDPDPDVLAMPHIIRDIFGNPFRPVALDPDWLTSDVLALARGIYADRAFDRMPILADALQDAGCDSDDVLTHCRDAAQVHVRGCWVVDLLLGK